MAKAIQHGYMLLPNPETAKQPIPHSRLPQTDTYLRNGYGATPHAKRNSSDGVYTHSMIEGESESCVFNQGTGMLMKTCPVIIPASWIIELEGPIAYLRRLAAHRKRVREEVTKARRDAMFALSARRQGDGKKVKYGASVKTPDSALVVPGSSARMEDPIFYGDLITVQCQVCKMKLLGAGVKMLRVVRYLFDVINQNDGSGVGKKRLREIVPRVQAVTFAVGESYCPSCVPGHSAKSERQARKAVGL